MLINHKVESYQKDSSFNSVPKDKRGGVFQSLNQFRLIVKNFFFYAILFFIIISLFFGFIGSRFRSFFKTVTPVPSVLVINPAQPIIEDSYFCDPQGESDYLFFFDLTESIRLAAKDKAIRYLLFDLSSLDALSFAQITELGTLIDSLPEEKKTIAYASSFSQNSYALASYCDRVLMEEEGMVYFQGIALKSLFFGELAKKWGVNVEVFRVGEMKSAAEPFIDTHFSEKSKENLKEITDELYRGLGNLIVNNRNQHREASAQKELTFADFDHYSSHFDSLLAKKQAALPTSKERIKLFSEVAKEAGWIDETFSLPVDPSLDQMVSTLLLSEMKSISFVDYLQKKSSSLPSKKIAVLTFEGGIEDRESHRVGSIDPFRFNKQIDLAFNDPQVKAVVLRINSPGGSADASESIRKKLVEISESTHKPLVVSMGGTCASGGFWVSTAAKEVYANDYSLTGSIGVFSVLPGFHSLLKNHLALHIDGVSAGGIGSFGSIEPMDDRARRFLQLGVETIYDQFLSITSDKTGLSPEAVDQKAQGRVFSGQSAYEFQLVDGVGSFYDAVGAAARLAEISNYQIDFRKRALTFSERLAKQVVDSFRNRATAPEGLSLELENLFDPSLKQLIQLGLGTNEGWLLYSPYFLEW